MVNIFSEIEDKIFFNEEIIFNEAKIRERVFDLVLEELNKKPENTRAFFFEEVVYDFFEYIRVDIIKTKKTRDFGVDGVVKLNLDLLGEINLGLQVKHKTIDSTDVDSFLISLRNSELQLGIIVCKDSRRLDKYELNSKIKAILLSRGIKIKERLIKENIDINPIFILKLDDIIDIVVSRIRGTVKAVYKK